jgi:hypothetical protein
MEPSPADLQEAIRLGQFILTLLPLAVFVQVGVAIWSGRRKPGVTEEVYRDYATKKELAELRHDFNKTMNELFSRQHLNQQDIDNKFNAIMRSVGQIEGQLKSCPNTCK